MLDSNLDSSRSSAPFLKLDSEQRAKIFAALGDPTRLRIVELLAQSVEMSGSELANHLEISLALFCHHSKTLVDCGLVQVRKEGQTKYSSLNRCLLAHCLASIKGLPNANSSN
ncbi:metalloregulator ArsR/SmtB family transcription factor [Trichocoleus sp. FACHB-262]|uniref:ArsR/SmtB family transcription factor n=1 Tax=Trichocoleus sp. FACHB-262 TaxID=2692869 RepID=UPI0016859BD2|nr:metalloregulator ArsR/SmtB family transcription factor [Trichocoleus sp. FACHB-262]MBD2123250.1 helix-turn-helix transcriptional regulator [Trichocoleus sp. FACHB-262]